MSTKTAAAENRSEDSVDIPLLNGEFCPEDSRESILQLLTDFKNQLQRRNFSHQVRFGKTDPWSASILNELAQSFETAKQLIKNAQDNQSSVILESSIKLLLCPVESSSRASNVVR